MLPKVGPVGTQDEPDQPTIAGSSIRALRALRASKPAVPDEDVSPADEAAAPPELTTAPSEAAEPVPEVAEVTEPEAEQVTEPEPEVAGPEPEQVAEPAAAPRKRNGLLIGSVVVLTAAAIYLVVTAVIYFAGHESSAAKAAQARDDALTAARIDIATLQTLDYRNAKAGLQQWLNVTTGSFHDQIAKDESSQEPVIANAKRITVGKVVAFALTDLNATAGTASAIATVDVTITPAGGTSALERNRYHANLAVDHGVWKIADLSLVPVGLS